MGLGDEIMALGRAERLFEQTGDRVSIMEYHGTPRDHIAWHGNPVDRDWETKKNHRIFRF